MATVAQLEQQIAAIVAHFPLTAADQAQLQSLQAQLTAASGVQPPTGSADFARYGINGSAIGNAGGVSVVYGYVPADTFDQSSAKDHHPGEDGTYWQNADGTWSAVSHGYSQTTTWPVDDRVSNAGWTPLKTPFGGGGGYSLKTGLPAAWLAAGTAKWQTDWVNTTQAIGASGANAIGSALGLGSVVKQILPQSGVVAQGYKNPPPAGGMPPIPPPPAAPPSAAAQQSSRRRALLIGGALVLVFVLWRVLA